MSSTPSGPQSPAARREGSLEAPTRHPLEWRTAEFYDLNAVERELERVFDICHGCRRCFSLCQSFPTLFEAVDASPSGELDGVPHKAYWEIVDHCYLCDMCYMTKCPYVPPHQFNVDFPHLMLRAKAVKHAAGRTSFRDRLLSSTDALGSVAGIPVVAELVNAVNATAVGRQLLSKTLGVHPDAPLPKFHSRSFRAAESRRAKPAASAVPTDETRGQVVLFATCYCNRNAPAIDADLAAVFEHNGIPVRLAARERCCGMPKLELGDLPAVEALKNANVPVLAALVDERQRQQAAVEKDLEAESARAIALSRQVGDLQGLIAKMEQDLKSAAKAAAAASQQGAQGAVTGKPNSAAFKDRSRQSPAIAFASAKGLLPLPVNGTKIRDFGGSDGVGGLQKGISLATRSGAQVTTPCDGWVVYAGPFRSYGQLLILNAGGGYHVLIAGMERISVNIGQFVLTGEPVATMGSTSLVASILATSASQPVLYVEFRKDGTPIDPGPWWAANEGEKVRG